MDVKRLAKSKRAHSQHHSKKPCSSHKPKVQFDSSNDAGGAKKTLVKQIGEKTHQSGHTSKLPSNWDRYEEELDSGSEDKLGDIPSQLSDVVVPKSKGADYRYLIAEAESQSLSQSASDGFTYLDDILPGDFSQAIGSMLSVRGEGILSWIGNDNFVVDDGATASHEATFLSLNLHALTQQLEKVDLPERLFIEPDLLPPELWAGGSKTNNNHETDQTPSTHKSEATTRISVELVNDFSEKVVVADQKTEIESSGFGSNSRSDSLSSDHGSCLVNQVKEVSTSGTIQAEEPPKASPFGESNQSRALESIAESKLNSFADSKNKTSTFEATAAEAELDALLGPFSETKFHDSSSLPVKNFLNSEGEAFISQPRHSRQDPALSQSATVTANFDDVLDDLIGEKSSLMNQTKLPQALSVNATPFDIQSSSSQSVTVSKEMEDFDSWLDTL